MSHEEAGSSSIPSFRPVPKDIDNLGDSFELDLDVSLSFSSSIRIVFCLIPLLG